MNCLRCSGLLVSTLCYDAWNSEQVSMWRCIQCGNLIDDAVHQNRLHGPSQVTATGKIRKCDTYHPPLTIGGR